MGPHAAIGWRQWMRHPSQDAHGKDLYVGVTSPSGYMHMAHGTWHTAHGTWHMAHGTWHMAHDTWHMAHDT